MKLTALSFAALAVSLAAPAQAQAVQPWPDVLVIKPLGDGWVGSVEVVGRASGNERQSQFESRLKVGHPLGRTLAAWAGWVHFARFVPGAPDTSEDQAVEQLNWAPGSVGRLRLVTRSRPEQRFLSQFAGTNWRFRQQMRAVTRPAARRRSVWWCGASRSLRSTTLPASAARSISSAASPA